MPTQERERAEVAASGSCAGAQRSRMRKLVAAVVGMTALGAAALGIAAAVDNGDDAPQSPTQVIPFVTTAPTGSGGNSADG